MKKLVNKVALVTGGTSGIGKSVVEKFISEGATVFFTGRNEHSGKKIESSFKEKAFFIKCDLSENGADKLVVSALNGYNVIKLDILINNAGIFDTPKFEDIDKENIEDSFKINTYAPILLTKALYEKLKLAGGNIVNVSSTSGLQSHIAGKRTYLYASSKAALIQFSQLCALNFAPEVRVNCICPGITETPIYVNRDFSRFLDIIPMKRVATAEEISKVILFLASNDASYITGAVLTVDGGASLL